MREVSAGLRLRQPRGWGRCAQGFQMEYPLIRGGADLSRRCAQEARRAGSACGRSKGRGGRQEEVDERGRINDAARRPCGLA